MLEFSSASQQAFSAALCRALRESRRRQRLTQAEVSTRTDGLISKAALAGYETGHRPLRVQDLLVLAGALGEQVQDLVAAAERGISLLPAVTTRSLDLDAEAVNAAEDSRLIPVQRWLQLRTQRNPTVTLDHQALSALSTLMNIRPAECRRLLEPFVRTVPTAIPAGTPDQSGRSPDVVGPAVGGGSRLPAQLSSAIATGESEADPEGPLRIRVSDMIASSDARVQLLRSVIELGRAPVLDDCLTLDASKITGLSLLLEMSTTEIRRLLMPFHQ